MITKFILQFNILGMRNEQKIVDCFLYNGEDQMLKFRLAELDEHVDYFIILESNKNFDGSNKNYVFNQSLLSDKLIYLKVDSTKEICGEELFSLYCEVLKKKITEINFDFLDIIVFSDIDEIPNFENLHEINSKLEINPVVLIQNNFFWNKELISEIKHFGSVLFFFSHILVEKNILFKSRRLKKTSLLFERFSNGWHFSNFYGDEEYLFKLKTLSKTYYTDEFYLKDSNLLFLRDNLLPTSIPNPSSELRLKTSTTPLPKAHHLLPNHEVGRKTPQNFIISTSDYSEKIIIPQKKYYSDRLTEIHGFEKIFFLNELKRELYDFFPINSDTFLFSDYGIELKWSDIKNNFLSELLLN